MPPSFRTVCPFILASASPRRKEMLNAVGLQFKVEAAEADEQVRQGERAEAFVLRVAEDKAKIVADRHPATWVLAADTVVVKDGDILGKPADANEAVLMLKRLAGSTHEVWTGFCLRLASQNRQIHQAIKTDVQFVTLSDQVIDAYVLSGDPLDKAGGYGIQSQGGFMVQGIHGSYSNVVGLPLAEVLSELMNLGLIQAAGQTG
ncbi:MAG: Maf family protein [Desulfobulbaceae bacterium]|nr:Maf family protein [Desulfobulbaceae bacterium]